MTSQPTRLAMMAFAGSPASNPTVRSRKAARLHGLRASRFWTWAVLVIGFVLTGLAYYTVRSDSEQAAQTRFDFRNEEVSNSIERRMNAYTQSLLGGLGLMRASNRVSRDEWRVYVETLDLQRRFPGIQGIGFSEWVKPDRRPYYEAQIRAQGFPDFTIRPEGVRQLYSSITYLEPFDERNRQAFGFDMYSEETRRAAMELARDSGLYAISGAVRLVQEITDDVQAGFLLYVPYYGPGEIPDTIEGRRERSIGFVYSAFRMRDLMEGILGPGLPNLRLQVYDGTEVSDAGLMYDSDPANHGGSAIFTQVRELELGQRTWTLRLSSLESFETLLDPMKSLLVLFGGVAVSLLFFGVLKSFATMRARAEALAADMTVTVAKRNADLARSNDELEQFAYIASHDLKAPLRGIDHLAVWIESDLGEKLDGEPKENMALLRARVRRLEALLSDLLNYSRAGRVDAPLETVEVREVLTEAFAMVRADQPFTLTVDTEIDTVVIRRSALEQVVTNLFSNAMKHHDRGEGQIVVRLRDIGTMYEFHVADDGPGIPEKLRERAFQMFQTLKPRDKVEGSGMGLAIIRKIVEHQGGKVRIEDGPDGRGAHFFFTWPKHSSGIAS